MEMSDSVAIRASSAVVSMFERSGGTNEDIRDAIAKAMLEEREICAKLAEANHTIKGKRIASLIRGTRRGVR